MKTFLKKYKFVYAFLKYIRSVFYVFYGFFIVLISLIEAPLFFIRHPMIFKNKIIYVFWHWSFGYNILGLDYVSRSYYPKRISVIYLSHPGSNKYLPYCFKHNMDIFTYSSIIPSGKEHLTNELKSNVIYLLLKIINIAFRKFHILDFNAVNKIFSSSKQIFLAGNEKKGQLEKTPDYTSYIRLIANQVGEKPCLPKDIEAIALKAIKEQYTDFLKKPFITLLLRKKGREEDFETITRSSGPQKNYIKLVHFLTESGYNVVGTGETQHEYFQNISGYYSLEDINIDKQLLNIFVLTHCVLFIGQHSGSYILLDSCGIPVLLCDSFSYRVGTFNKDDIILFKHFKEKATGKKLSLVEVLVKHIDLAYGYNFAKKGIQVECNTEDEILEAGKESLARINGTLHLSEEEEMLAERFRNLFPKTMLIAHEGNRSPLYVLSKLKKELMDDSISSRFN